MLWPASQDSVAKREIPKVRGKAIYSVFLSKAKGHAEHLLHLPTAADGAHVSSAFRWHFLLFGETMPSILSLWYVHQVNHLCTQESEECLLVCTSHETVSYTFSKISENVADPLIMHWSQVHIHYLNFHFKIVFLIFGQLYLFVCEITFLLLFIFILLLIISWSTKWL